MMLPVGMDVARTLGWRMAWLGCFVRVGVVRILRFSAMHSDTYDLYNIGMCHIGDNIFLCL